MADLYNVQIVLRRRGPIGFLRQMTSRWSSAPPENFDARIDYRRVEDLRLALADACPDGIDVFFDNVGGDILEAVLGQVNRGAGIAICGTIGLPAGEAAYRPRVERQLLVKRPLMQGFLAIDHLDRMDAIVAELAGYLGDCRLRYREKVAPELTDAPSALQRVLAGKNVGKSILRVAEPSAAVSPSSA